MLHKRMRGEQDQIGDGLLRESRLQAAQTLVGVPIFASVGVKALLPAVCGE